MIVGLCGFSKTGKDSLADCLENYDRFAFADELKREVTRMLRAVGIGADVWGEDKEDWRELLVYWGKKRRIDDRDWWVKQVWMRMCGTYDSSDLTRERIIITDVRYINEVRHIEKWGGIVVRLIRPGYEAANAEEKETIREIDLLRPDLPRIINDGTPQDMEKLLRRVVNKELVS